MNGAPVPDAVYTLWWIGLAATLLVFVPLAVYLLHRTWQAARLIQRYAADALAAAGGIAANTAHVAALDTTIGVATQMYELADAVEQKLAVVADVLATRAG